MEPKREGLQHSRNVDMLLLNRDEMIEELEKLFKTVPVMISVCRPPSFISYFESVDDSEEIILVHKKELPNTSSDYSGFDVEDDDALGDITGNPLSKCLEDISILNETAFCIDTKMANEMPPGLTIIEARQVISVYNMKVAPSSLPIWVVCDVNMMGDKGRNIRLLTSQKRSDSILIGWAIDSGSHKLEPNPKTLILQNNDGFENYISRQHKIKCQYHISDHMMEGPSGSCNLNMIWNDLVFFPPTSSQSLILSMKTECTIGKSQGCLRFIWEQLLLINAYFKCVKTERFDQELPVNYFVLSQLPPNSSPPIMRLQHILREPIGEAKTSSKVGDLLECISNISTIPNYKLDVIGQLWYLFIECRTHQELTECMKQLKFKLNGMVGSQLKQILLISSITSSVDVLQPLKYLVEFGMEKLKREMLEIFSEVRVGFKSCLPITPKLSSLPIGDWRQAVRSNLQWLAQSYCLLELLVYTQHALKLDNDYLNCLSYEFYKQLKANGNLKADIDYYRDNPAQCLTANIQPQYINEQLLKSVPTRWLMTVVSKFSNKYAITSQYYFGTEDPFVKEYSGNHWLESDCSKTPDICSAELHISNYMY